MDIEQMKKTAHRFHIDIIQDQKLEVADEILDINCPIRSPLSPPNEQIKGPEKAKNMAIGDAKAFPTGLFFHHDDAIAEGNWVSIRWDAKGMNTGPLGTIPPANKEVTFSGVDIYRFNEEGKIAEVWVYYDVLNILKQVGAEVKMPGS